jgi:hypothetical protein
MKGWQVFWAVNTIWQTIYVTVPLLVVVVHQGGRATVAPSLGAAVGTSLLGLLVLAVLTYMWELVYENFAGLPHPPLFWVFGKPSPAGRAP